jgi:protoporphyrin/coproporphyrin ferrochelatase
MRVGILLCNLGTPSAPTAAAIRPWLSEFLHDYRVVDLSRWIWCPILHFFILPLRPRRLAHAYASIWTPQGSPLLKISREQQAALQTALGDEVPVVLGMRYGEPRIADGLADLQRRGVRRVIVLPLYPQYSRTTTASVEDAVKTALARMDAPPTIDLVQDYHDHPAYIEALAASVRNHWARNGQGEHLLLSLHGIPQRYADAGDPYAKQCERTAAMLAEALSLPAGSWTLAYQSRVGRAPWLQPYTDDAVAALARRGLRTLDVLCPGFSADCLETLEEVAQRYAGLFRTSGGGELRYIPALNADAPQVTLLRQLVEGRLRAANAG